MYAYIGASWNIGDISLAYFRPETVIAMVRIETMVVTFSGDLAKTVCGASLLKVTTKNSIFWCVITSEGIWQTYFLQFYEPPYFLHFCEPPYIIISLISMAYSPNSELKIISSDNYYDVFENQSNTFSRNN